MITDVEITVRDHGSTLLDQLNIGPARGIKPPYPTRVPRDRKYAGTCQQHNDQMYRDAAYIQKSLNSWNDGKEYWQVKPNRIPKAWLDLEVYSWDLRSASCFTPRRSCPSGVGRNVNFHGEQINIVALPSGQELSIKTKEKEKTETGDPDMIEGQMSLDDWNYDTIEN